MLPAEHSSLLPLLQLDVPTRTPSCTYGVLAAFLRVLVSYKFILLELPGQKVHAF